MNTAVALLDAWWTWRPACRLFVPLSPSLLVQQIASAACGLPTSLRSFGRI